MTLALALTCGLRVGESHCGRRIALVNAHGSLFYFVHLCGRCTGGYSRSLWCWLRWLRLRRLIHDVNVRHGQLLTGRVVDENRCGLLWMRAAHRNAVLIMRMMNYLAGLRIGLIVRMMRNLNGPLCVCVGHLTRMRRILVQCRAWRCVGSVRRCAYYQSGRSHGRGRV